MTTSPWTNLSVLEQSSPEATTASACPGFVGTSTNCASCVTGTPSCGRGSSNAAGHPSPAGLHHQRRGRRTRQLSSVPVGRRSSRAPHPSCGEGRQPAPSRRSDVRAMASVAVFAAMPPAWVQLNGHYTARGKRAANKTHTIVVFFCWLLVVGCWLLVVGWLLVVCCLLFVCLLFVVCCLLFVVCCCCHVLSCVVGCWGVGVLGVGVWFWTLPFSPCAPCAEPPCAGPPKISLFFFPSPATIFALFRLSLSGCLLVEFWCFRKAEKLKHQFWPKSVWPKSVSTDSRQSSPGSHGQCTHTLRVDKAHWKGAVASPPSS